MLSHPGPDLSGWQFEQVLPALVERAVSYIADRARNPNPFFLFDDTVRADHSFGPVQREKWDLRRDRLNYGDRLGPG